MIDPISAITTISLGLKAVDQFRELVFKIRGRPVPEPSANVEHVGPNLEILHKGGPTQEVRPDELKLDFWDETRYQALQRRTRINWSLLQEYDVQSVAVGPGEMAVLKVRMGITQEELCHDFREMVTIFERTMGMSLPDHYKLYEVCQAG